MEKGLLDAAPIWTNLKTFPWSEFRGKVDVLSGGYPCQPFSTSGKRLGTEDPRHLWPYIANGIRLMRPNICFFENVEGHITLGLREVISELETIGYRTTWGIFSAREVGAPHRRKRIFILAHSDSFRHNWPKSNSINKWIVQEQTLIESKQSLVRSKIERCSNELFDSNCENVEGYGDNACGIQTQNPVIGDSGWWKTERGLGRVAHGHPYWVDRLRLCGNGVVPATATLAFNTLMAKF